MTTKIKPRDLVLAKMPSYPPWPSFLMPKEMIPDGIVGQKRKSDTCVIFIPEGDYIWLDGKELKPLTEELLAKTISSTKNAGKTKKLLTALKLAQGLRFDTFMSYLERREVGYKGDLQSFLEEEVNDGIFDEEDNEQKEAFLENGEANEQLTEVETADDELDEKGERSDLDVTNDGSIYTTKSRPKGRGTTRNGVKIKTGELNGDSIKLEVDKTSDDEITRKRKNSDINGNKRFKTVSPGPISESNGTGAKMEDSSKGKNLSEDQKLQQLWLCRIKLQKSLIQRVNDSSPTIDELLISRLILHKLADFPVDLNLLKTTKIHKVLKCILKDPEFELNESFRLHDKCNELLDKWATLIDTIKREKNAKYDDSEVSDIKEKPVKTIVSES